MTSKTPETPERLSQSCRAHDVNTGRPMVVDGHICIVRSKTGTDPILFSGSDIFTRTHHQSSYTAADVVETPTISSTSYTLIAMARNGFLSLKSATGEVRNDLTLAENYVGKIIKVAMAGPVRISW